MRPKSPTLYDEVFRASFSNSPNPTLWPVEARGLWRDAITKARRFVLDDNMSRFLSDLSIEAFQKEQGNHALLMRMLESLRMNARLPHGTTWIEYNIRAHQARTTELLGRNYVDSSEVPEVEGWLIQQHPKIDTAFIAHLVSSESRDLLFFPMAIAWTTDDTTVLPWKPLPFSERSISHGYAATGIRGYNTDRAAFVFSPMVHTPNKPDKLAIIIREWVGLLRRIWAFLATINDLPVLLSDTAVSKGFVARGQYRRFLSHKTITINVPQKHYRKTIRTALALAHRRAHSVRGHWRIDWRHPLSKLCDHEWSADDKHMDCTRCKGRKSWITEHERGDASRGFVTHDYLVKHEI
jgi:hypothetical protein